jgi:hypothetical protein
MAITCKITARIQRVKMIYIREAAFTAFGLSYNKIAAANKSMTTPQSLTGI